MKKFALISAMMVAISAVGAWADCAEEGTVGTITFANAQQDGKTICVATIDATGEEDFVISKDYTVEKIVFDRTSNAKEYQTVVLPITVVNGSTKNVDFCDITEIKQYDKNQPWYISCIYTSPDNLEQNKPYLMKVTPNETVEIVSNFWNGGKITIHKTTSADAQANPFAENWEFRGTYSYKKWEEGDSQIGHVYGFAATNGGEGSSVKAGQFVKVKAGAFIKPMRAYLYYNKPATNPAPANSNVLAKAAAEEELPESIEVIFRDENGEVMSIAQMNTMTGEVTAVEGWFDLKGRKLNQKPTQKGTYFNNGKKVVIK